jgi:hypothetical protein
MTTKPPLQKILQGILHIENEKKKNKTKPWKGRQYQTTEEEKPRKQRVTLIQLHTIKPLINKKTTTWQGSPHIYQYYHWMLMD